MKDSERFRLIGTYKPLRVKIGTVLSCEFRDCDVVVTGYSDGKITWPIGSAKGIRAKTLVICGDLAEAIRKESNQAVCYWWGVTPQTVTKWRKALDVGTYTEGTNRLQTLIGHEPFMEKARKIAYRTLGDPERSKKVSEALKGRPKPPHIMEALRHTRIGYKHSPESRARMSRAQTGRKMSPESIKKRQATRQRLAKLRKKKADDT